MVKDKSKVKSEKSKVKEGDKTRSSLYSALRTPHSSNFPQTMEELLAMTGYTLKGIKKGDVIEGAIRRVSPKEITVDIGRKTECVVIDRELETYKDALMALKPGDTVICQVIVEENDRGNPVVSLRR
ncbi:S1 RNA-binding domain-containing protein, partial [Candidatus Gottesmanbacteria bacterium]|nr:S1 RNA-binding domain-containing protein [Candidatus Gottesmanbacteria bacterium]